MLKITNEKNVQELAKMFYTAKSVSSSQVTREEDGFSYQTMSPSWTSNENSSYMHRIITTGSNVLAVAGSFDHIIDMAMYGARNIYAVDVNPLQFPVDWLKYQAVMSLTAGQFKKFALNTRADMLSNELMSIILERTEDSVEKEFWEKVRKALSESTIYLERKDIFDMYIPENVFDVVCLSNLHNFYPIDYYVDKLKELSSKLKKNGKIVLYFIGMKPEWFRSWDKNLLPDIQEEDLNRAYIKDGIKEFGVLQQINNTGNLYKKLKKYFKVLIIPVKTGKGYMFYNTPTDCILVLQSK